MRGGFLRQIDNQYLDSNRIEKDKAPGAGRKSDPMSGGGYADVKLVDGTPEFMNKDAKTANKGGTYGLAPKDKAPFDEAKFAAGDEGPSILVEPFTGERGVIKTSSKFDVQFTDLSKVYGFGAAFFDNAQVRHAQVREPLHLTFAT